MGLGPAVELARPAGPVLRLAAQGRFQALLDEAPADALDSGDAHLDGLGDAPVRPGGAARRGVGLQEDAGAGQFQGSCLAGSDEFVELLAFVPSQRNLVPLHPLSPEVPKSQEKGRQLHSSCQPW